MSFETTTSNIYLVVYYIGLSSQIVFLSKSSIYPFYSFFRQIVLKIACLKNNIEQLFTVRERNGVIPLKKSINLIYARKHCLVFFCLRQCSNKKVESSVIVPHSCRFITSLQCFRLLPEVIRTDKHEIENYTPHYPRPPFCCSCKKNYVCNLSLECYYCLGEITAFR